MHQPRLVSLNDVCLMTSLSRTTINKKRKYDPTFPAEVPLGDKRIAFVLSEVEAWIEKQIAARPA